MLGFIDRFFQQSDLLIELGKNNIKIKSFCSDVEFEDLPYIAIETTGTDKIVKAIGASAKNMSAHNIDVSNPFELIELGVFDFLKAERVLQHCIYQIHILKKFRLSPRIILHVEGSVDNLPEEFQKKLIQLVENSGAREVVVYQGRSIDIHVESFKSIKARCAAS
ncbi:rod shape-determining protein MreB [Vibrio parahaemolyticus]|uniref:rod shape-determining protein MreB n=1 Tax=Vibrio parahaemolyticus TaxID=670 RepID=UPI001123803F|nr:rod shape-determining protein MreB [Vibrio parahaemolyticus]ELA9326186.1 hypothetical protein [Vibrio parahaemolyticus]ELB2245001.1 hypothetical protein [Vibrio parahaemolyticus]TOF46600.1 rod shape-determining protein MreB [Vibrio parahaemolyticus]HCE2149572.1 hypothetical protein [Vibrio parahaemolyticus]